MTQTNVRIGLSYRFYRTTAVARRRRDDMSETGKAGRDAGDTRDPRDPRDMERWFVMRAYKCEAKAEERLAADGGLEYFIPKRYAVRSYHGVKSRRLVPAIPSLVFVRASRRRIIDFKRDNNFLQYVMRRTGEGDDFLIVPDEQMDNFLRVASHPEENLRYLRPDEVNIGKGTRVRIHGGPFDGVEGTFMRTEGVRDRRLVVLLEGVMAVSAKVHPDLVEVLK